MIGQNVFIFLSNGILVASLYLWYLASRRISNNESLLAWTPRRHAPWHSFHLLGTVLILLIVLLAVPFISTRVMGFEIGEDIESMSASQQLSMIMLSSFGMLTGSILAAIYLFFFAGASLHDLGFNRQSISKDLLNGLAGFVMLIFPVLMTQLVLTKLFPNANQHPFVELIKASPNPTYIWWIFVAAVLIAPIVEEFLFRVVFQGWLESLLRDPRFADSSEPPTTEFETSRDNDAFPTSISNSGLAEEERDEQTLFDELRHKDEATFGPRGLGAQDSVRSHEIARIQESDELDRPTLWLPILVSAFVFAICHGSHGTAPVPLFILAVGLGYLYQRTHRIWPSLMVHMLTNLVAVIQLQILISQGQ